MTKYFDYVTKYYSHDDLLKVITFIDKNVKPKVGYKVCSYKKIWFIELDWLTDKQCNMLETFEKDKNECE